MVMHFEYPIHLGIAYLFLIGYLWSRCFRALNLPGAVGIIVSGFIFSHFIQSDLLQGRDHLQSLAFFLVLLTAGFEISMDELKLETFVFALFPVTLELVGISGYAVGVLEYGWIEGLVLGTTLCCLGDGLVIPKMVELKNDVSFQKLGLPRLVFTWAPLEASYVLTLFGIIQGLAEPAEQEGQGSIVNLVFANIVRLVATLGFGSLMGWVAAYVVVLRRQGPEGWTVSMVFRTLQRVLRREDQERPPEPEEDPQGPTEATGEDLFFSGSNVEAYLLILCVALAGFGLGASEGLTPVPMPFSAGSLFQPELLVIVIGASFAYFAGLYDDEKLEVYRQELLKEGMKEGSEELELLLEEFEERESTLEGVMQVVGGVWTFGQLVLFSMLGSKTDLGVFQQIFFVLPIMVVGKLCRLLGVVLATYGTIHRRTCGPEVHQCECVQVNQRTCWRDAQFCFLSTLPRATIQGALGPIPMRDRFFSSDPLSLERTQFIAASARLYVVIMAIFGSILLDRYGKQLSWNHEGEPSGDPASMSARRCQ
ncbi:Uncharacterized protein SCF082_LOCUS30576 [Durusdinium trenchii]|uniref:Sodium/hydrogen exchanger n=1 Tax=Durusdinium trenchii TaxID=1381693 RepID=A0ABP0MZ62_9DINO